MTSLLRGSVLAVAVFVAISLGFAHTAKAAPVVSLSPESGEAPSVSGSIIGSGWLCDSSGAPGPTASVIGPGVSGSALINRDGTLSGNFAITGEPGDSIVVLVRADDSCPTIGPPIYLEATADFTFNAPADTPTPRPSRTPTAVPTATVAPSATAPVPADTPPPAAPTATAPGTRPTSPAATPTGAAGRATPSATSTAPPGPAASSGAQTATFTGCTPEGPVEFEFVPLNLLGVDEPSDAPTGPGIMVPAVQTGEPGTFEFDPPEAEPGRIFRVTPKIADPDCGATTQDPADYWIDGQPLIVPMTLPGATQLQICAVGDKVPCEYPVVKGARIRRGEPARISSDGLFAVDAWVTEKEYFAEDLKKGKFRFRSSVEASGAVAARLQASVWPYPKGSEQDPLSPPGLIAEWDIGCVNCEFTVDLSGLAPQEPPKKKTWYKKAAEGVATPFKAAGEGAWKAVTWVGDLVGLGGGSSEGTVKATKVEQATTPQGEYVVTTPVKIPPASTFYFRLLPLDDATKGAIAGPASNTVRLQQVEKPPDIKIALTPTPTVTITAYDVEILSYHGIIPPVVPNKICYIATQNAWPADIYGLTFTTDPNKAVSTGVPPVKAGQPICKPDPKEPSIIEAIISWAEDAVNWASAAWDDLKAFAVDVILKYTPLGLQCTIAEDAGAIPDGACETAFAVALDAALVSLGIPPDIPNFDELVDQGVTYLAAEIAAQVAIPPDVVKAAVEEGGPYAGLALSVAEEKLREELQQEIEGNLKDAALSIQLGHAASVAWVPDGIPVRPDDYQPPGMTVRVTRKQGVPGGDTGCIARIRDTLTLSKGTLEPPPPGYAGFLKGLPHPLSALTTYDLLGDEKGAGIDKELHVPALAPGESYTIPMTFKPNYYNSGWHPLGLVPVSEYIAVWRFLHDFGTIHLSADGSCGTDKLDTPAKAILLGGQVTP